MKSGLEELIEEIDSYFDKKHKILRWNSGIRTKGIYGGGVVYPFIYKNPLRNASKTSKEITKILEGLNQ